MRDDDFERAIKAVYQAFSDGDHLLELSDLKRAEEEARAETAVLTGER